MSKKRSKTPSASRKVARKLEAPKLITRDGMEATAPAEDMTPIELPVEMAVEPMPTMADALIVEAPMLVETVLPAEPAEAIAEPVVVAEAPMPIEISRGQIARLAFAKFAQRGYVHGYHVEDWLSAEAELRARA